MLFAREGAKENASEVLALVSLVDRHSTVTERNPAGKLIEKIHAMLMPYFKPLVFPALAALCISFCKMSTPILPGPWHARQIAIRNQSDNDQFHPRSITH